MGSALGNSWRIGTDDYNWETVLQDIDNMVRAPSHARTCECSSPPPHRRSLGRRRRHRLRAQAPLWPYAGPHGFNDPCLLLGRDSSGNAYISEPQSRMQFSMWAVLMAPNLLSQDVRNLSAYALETYSNVEVIAVNQDERLRQGQRMAGGPISAMHLHDNNVPVTLQQCTSARNVDALGYAREGASAPVSSQVWQWNVSAPGYVSNPATTLVLNVDDCGTAIIAYPPVTSGGTCCGADCYDNQVFAIQGDGTLRSPLAASQCVTSAGVGAQVTLQPCTASPTQQWAYDASSGVIGDGRGNCLTVGGAVMNLTNVWGRPLDDGSWAMTYINVGLNIADVDCDYSSCLAATGWEPEQLVTVRDVWAHADVGVFPASGGWNVSAMDADGGFAMFKLTPWFNTSAVNASSAAAAASGGAVPLPVRRSRGGMAASSSRRRV